MEKIRQGSRMDGREDTGMVVTCLQLTGVALSVLGWFASVACCLLPLWKIILFSGQTLMAKQQMVEGLWINCIVLGPGKANCRTFGSSGKEVTLEVYMGRILTLSTVTMTFLGLFVSCLGAPCNTCVRGRELKSRLLTASGVTFLVAGVAQLLAVSWPAYVLATEFHHPLVSEVLHISLGSCIYLGWLAGTLLLAGGALICCPCCCRRRADYGGQYPVSGRASEGAGRNFV